MSFPSLERRGKLTSIFFSGLLSHASNWKSKKAFKQVANYEANNVFKLSNFFVLPLNNQKLKAKGKA